MCISWAFPCCFVFKSCALMIRSRVPARPYGRRCIGSSERAIPSPFSASSQLPTVPLFRGSDRGSKGPPHMAPMVAALTDGGEGVGDGQTWVLVLCFNQHKNYDLRFETNTLEATGGTSTLFLIIPYDYNCLLFWFSFRVSKTRGMTAQNHLHSDENPLWPIDQLTMLTWHDAFLLNPSASIHHRYVLDACTRMK